MMDEPMIDEVKERPVGGLVRKASDLRVYKTAFEVSIEVHKATLDFPKIEQYALANQMRRASKSVCANLAEGFIKQQFSAAEFKRFIAIAMGSASEMQVWVEYCFTLGYVEQEQAGVWLERYDHIIRMLQSLRTHTR